MAESARLAERGAATSNRALPLLSAIKIPSRPANILQIFQALIKEDIYYCGAKSCVLRVETFLRDDAISRQSRRFKTMKRV